MGNGPAVIQTLEKAIGKTFKQVEGDQLIGLHNAYETNETEDIIGLCFYEASPAVLARLAGLTQLKRLGLLRCKIQDVSPLASLTALTSLHLNSDQIQDVSPLAA